MGILIGFGLQACQQVAEEVAPPSFSLEREATNYLSAMAGNHRFNGQVLIAKGDNVLYRKALGYADRSNEKAFDDSSRFLIGSITKPFTAAAVLILVESGELALEDRLNKYFPEFPRAHEVTIRHLLNHTSGIKDYHELPNWKEESQRALLTSMDVVKAVARESYRYEPGEKFHYSNTGYILLGLIIEQVSGQTFDHYLDMQIFQPLGLSHTGVIKNSVSIPNLVKGYRTNPLGSQEAEWINYDQPFSSGNVYSNLEDLRCFTRAVFQGTLFATHHLESIGAESSSIYELGWGIRSLDSLQLIGHVGAMNGFVGGISYWPEEDLFIGYLTNDDNTPRFEISHSLSQLALGYKVPIPERKTYRNQTDVDIGLYTGRYLVKPGDTLRVYEDGGQLYLQETGQESHIMFGYGANRFDFERLEFNAVFRDSIGEGFQTLVFENKGNTFLQANRVPKGAF
ncbi:beta-lactamase family protein [bacterium SCSIO 12741]|nr:beta-lactamase family protein [bacterium SCSIO 12741]